MGHRGVLQKQNRAIQKNHSTDLRPEKSSHEREVRCTEVKLPHFSFFVFIEVELDHYCWNAGFRSRALE